MFPKQNRVTKHLFDEVFSSGKKVDSQHFYLKYIPLEEETLKFSVVVPKKVERKAAKRNTLKRKAIAGIEDLFPQLAKGYAGIIMLTKNLEHLSHKEISQELKEIFTKAHILSL